METSTLNVRKTVLREQKSPFEIKSNTNYEKMIYDKLKEAELEINSTQKRYTLDEVMDSINGIIK